MSNPVVPPEWVITSFQGSCKKLGAATLVQGTQAAFLGTSLIEHNDTSKYT